MRCLPPSYISALRAEFNETRRLRLDTPNGRSLWIVDVTAQCHEPAVLIAYEGGGAMRFEFDRPLNAYRLVSSGFSGGIAHLVNDLLNALFPPRMG